jgi:hypothetical protein
MTAREVNGILEILDFVRLARKDASLLEFGLSTLKQHGQATIAEAIQANLNHAWEVANGILGRGGWLLGEGAETGVPKAVPMAANANEAAKMQERLEMAGSVGEGALPEEVEEDTPGEFAAALRGGEIPASGVTVPHQKPVTRRKKGVTGGRNGKK